MKEFEAKKKYYIHEWSAMKDWFGNRGIGIIREDLDEWCYDGDFLYFVPSKDAPEEIQDGEEGAEVVVCSFDSICYECDHVMPYEDSPFSNKLNEKNHKAETND